MQADLRKKVVFLGTPMVASQALRILCEQASHLIQLILVVSQAPARSGRTKELIPSPVHSYAISQGIPVLTPETAKDESFLRDLESLKPDLCITAAYGNYLPKRFLNIPKFGTLNIHPSLLPLYRGAAPVQRCLEKGDAQTGVTLLFSTSAMDAGPILAQSIYTLDSQVQADELLCNLFEKGTKLLIQNLPTLFSNRSLPKEQNHEMATHAPKIGAEEAWLDFSLPASVLHNKVRAFAPWPGTKAMFLLNDEPIEVKILTSAVSTSPPTAKLGEIFYTPDSIDICCRENTLFQIKELQLAGKKRTLAKDFQNGLKGKRFVLK